jgi:hypothetical protein
MGVCISSWWSGWSSTFCGLLVHQRRGDRAVGSGGFLPYACYCFVSSSWLVLSMLEMQVSPYACYCFVSSSWLVLSMLEMQASPYACYCFVSSSWLVLSMLEMQVSLCVCNAAVLYMCVCRLSYRVRRSQRRKWWNWCRTCCVCCRAWLSVLPTLPLLWLHTALLSCLKDWSWVHMPSDPPSSPRLRTTWAQPNWWQELRRCCCWRWCYLALFCSLRRPIHGKSTDRCDRWAFEQLSVFRKNTTVLSCAEGTEEVAEIDHLAWCAVQYLYQSVPWHATEAAFSSVSVKLLWAFFL